MSSAISVRFDDDAERAVDRSLGGTIVSRGQTKTEKAQQSPASNHGSQNLEDRRFTFGKYKGKTFSEVETSELVSYCQFLKSQPQISTFVEEFLNEARIVVANRQKEGQSFSAPSQIGDSYFEESNDGPAH